MPKGFSGPNQAVLHGEIVCVPNASVSVWLPRRVRQISVMGVPQRVLPFENGVVNGDIACFNGDSPSTKVLLVMWRS